MNKAEKKNLILLGDAEEGFLCKATQELTLKRIRE